MGLFGKPKHPYWVQHSHLFKDDEYRCSKCGYKADWPKPVCPGCGSKMGASRDDANWVDEAEIMDILFGEDE
jgi:predicted amidophosphoribosyltransferase